MFIRILALSSALLAAAVPAGAQQFNDWLAPHAAYTVGTDSRESDGQSYYDSRQVAYDNGYRQAVPEYVELITRTLVRARDYFAPGLRSAADADDLEFPRAIERYLAANP